MAEITAGMVKELRELTGLGMMECKKALEEAARRHEEGRGAAAHQERRQGLQGGCARGGRRRDRRPTSRRRAPGRAGRSERGDRLRGQEPGLRRVRAGVAKLVAEDNPADIAALASLRLGGETVESARQKLVQKIGENIAVRRFERITSDGKLVQYVHPGSKIAVIVDLDGTGGGGEGRRDAHRVRQAEVHVEGPGTRPTRSPPSARSSRRAPPNRASRRRSSRRWSRAASTSSSPRSRCSASRS